MNTFNLYLLLVAIVTEELETAYNSAYSYLLQHIRDASFACAMLSYPPRVTKELKWVLWKFVADLTC